MRTPYICGNWKMNLAPEAAADFTRQLVARLGPIDGVQVGLAPTFLALGAVRDAIAGSPLKLVAQNCHWADQGAFTGEVSASMLREIGCTGVIVGHSERRQYFGETDETVRARAKAALDAGLEPIVCVGETLAEREAGQTLHVVGRQIRAAFAGIAPEQLRSIVVAYEPVWAIGTGKVATATQAQEVHSAIRGWLSQLAGMDGAAAIRIQYGGSVKADNAAELFSQPDIDGALVGGASLKVEEFARIVSATRV